MISPILPETVGHLTNASRMISAILSETVGHLTNAARMISAILPEIASDMTMMIVKNTARMMWQILHDWH